jgi:hypothetical protein
LWQRQLWEGSLDGDDLGAQVLEGRLRSHARKLGQFGGSQSLLLSSGRSWHSSLPSFQPRAQMLAHDGSQFARAQIKAGSHE